jgi:hypothetical protein
MQQLLDSRAASIFSDRKTTRPIFSLLGFIDKSLIHYSDEHSTETLATGNMAAPAKIAWFARIGHRMRCHPACTILRA